MKLNKSTNERWLITGGLGYIGAHVAREFILAGFEVVIVDNLSTGSIDRLPDGVHFIQCDVRDSDFINEICNKFEVSGVVHLAAFKHARESKLKPEKYFSNNIGGVLGLIKGLNGTSVEKFIFSSSCSIYGNATCVSENSPPNPQSPYALSKYHSEVILTESLKSIGIAFTSLRFFNVIGCDDFTKSHDQSEECLIPVIQNKAANNEPIEIFGTRLETPDGTCQRDYLDVRDIARAHALVSKYISEKNFPASINLSSGAPTSVKEIVHEFELVLQRRIEIVEREPNSADPIAIWAERSSFLSGLGWKPLYTVKDSIQSHVIASFK